MKKSDRLGRRTVALQIAMVAAGFCLMAVLPPAEGSLLLLPMKRQPLAETAELAIGVGAALEGQGPFGSLRVRGRRDALAAATTGRGYLLLRAGAFSCQA